jgi:hypothetical protein
MRWLFTSFRIFGKWVFDANMETLKNENQWTNEISICSVVKWNSLFLRR